MTPLFILLAALAAMVGVVLWTRRAAASRGLLVNPSSLGRSMDLSGLLRGPMAAGALYSGTSTQPTALLFPDPDNGHRLDLAKGWQPAPAAELQDLARRLEQENARVLAAATAEDAEGRREVLGWVYTPGSTRPRETADRPGVYHLAPVPPFRKSDDTPR
jgi:hypothetical protein